MMATNVKSKFFCLNYAFWYNFNTDQQTWCSPGLLYIHCPNELFNTIPMLLNGKSQAKTEGQTKFANLCELYKFKP